MKATVKDEIEVGFTPFTIKVTIEHERELCDLWHRLNAAELCFNEQNYNQSNLLKCGVNAYASIDLFHILNNKVNEFHLKNT